MTQNQARNSADVGSGETPIQYVIDLDSAEEHGRAMPVLIASRRCYQDQQADDEEPNPASDPRQYIERIVDHCAQTPDYLLPDTPLKEAIFRVVLAGGNKPITAEEVSEILSEKWAMTAYPRDLSPYVVRRLLDNSESYCIVRIVNEEEDSQRALPEPAEEEPAEEEPAGEEEPEDEIDETE
jgi:hypothetical protein